MAAFFIMMTLQNDYTVDCKLSNRAMNNIGRTFWLVLTLLLFCYIAQSQPFDIVTHYRMGENKIKVVESCYKNCRRRMLFINVHDNEQTSRVAADSFLKEHGGKLVHFANDSGRNISFLLNNHCFAFDPNRIYSRGGRLASLTLLADSTSEQNIDGAEKVVSLLAKKILQKYIDKRPLIVALHNNSDSNFSIRSYLHSQDSLPNSGMCFVNPAMDEDDFILTTDRKLFAAIKAKNISVVWENEKVIKDDGSLSVYAALQHIPYINIEAEHGHLAQQLQMLRAVVGGRRK